MMNLDLTTFDQTAILFLFFGAIGLIRERRVLPFLILLIGGLLQGPLVAVMVAALVIWHRVDRMASRWIQLKDFFGLVLIIGGVLTGDAMHSFCAFFGVFWIAVNFGGGLLGTLPALMLLRQYYPHPEYTEIAFAGAGLWGVTAEVLRLVKTKHEQTILAILEGMGSLAILASFRPDVEKWTPEPLLVGGAGFFLLVALVFFVLVRFRKLRFFELESGLRNKMIRVLTAGGRMIDGSEPWSKSKAEAPALEFERGLDHAVFIILGVIGFVALFILLQKGGLT